MHGQNKTEEKQRRVVALAFITNSNRSDGMGPSFGEPPRHFHCVSIWFGELCSNYVDHQAVIHSCIVLNVFGCFGDSGVDCFLTESGLLRLSKQMNEDHKVWRLLSLSDFEWFLHADAFQWISSQWLHCISSDLNGFQVISMEPNAFARISSDFIALQWM